MVYCHKCFWKNHVWVIYRASSNHFQVSQFRCETPGCVNSAWTYREERGQFYLHQYLKEQPDLNYRTPAVIDEMIDVLMFWLDLGVDGFRQDTVVIPSVILNVIVLAHNYSGVNIITFYVF
jgi:glycosidase